MKIGVITTSRADYGIYFPLLKRLHEDDFCELKVIVLGMHLAEKFGKTSEIIVKDGFDCLIGEGNFSYSDDSKGIALSSVETSESIMKILNENEFDLIICLGDRFEMMAATMMVIPYSIPMAHIHGGEVSKGAMDEKYRHAITKLSDYHFVTCSVHKDRVEQMGVAPSRVVNSGSLGVETIRSLELLSIEQFNEKYSVDLSKPTYLCTYHPVTMENENSEYHITEFIAALETLLTTQENQILITLSNADIGNNVIRKKLVEFSEANEGRVFCHESLGGNGYMSAMKHSRLILGNSSSGIIEAASLNRPVVDIGNRQLGRERSGNVVHSAEDRESIVKAIQLAEGLVGREFVNIYEQDSPSKKIVDYLKELNLQIDTEFCDIKSSI